MDKEKPDAGLPGSAAAAAPPTHGAPDGTHSPLHAETSSASGTSAELAESKIAESKIAEAKIAEATRSLALPVARSLQPGRSGSPQERTGVFSALVTDDADIAGLVAYSIYKQNKLDWFSAFERAKGRAPNDDEIASYIIGEGTPRRIATYRHLAEATLAGRGPGASVAGGGGQGPRIGLRPAGALGDNARVIVTYAIIALVFLVASLLAVHYTMTSR